jgi:hypothetical protein
MIVIICSLQFSVFAHLDMTSLSIKGGEKFKAGDTVTIGWKLKIFHNVIDRVAYSSDSGATWIIIDTLKEKSGVMQMSCKWIVPPIVTNKARIRVFQTAITQPTVATGDYTLVSPVFSIENSTSIVSPIQSKQFTGNKSGKNTTASRNSFYNLSGRKLVSGSKKLIQIFIPGSLR